MPTQLDQAIGMVVEKLMADNGPLSIDMVDKLGVKMPILQHAPATLSDYFAHYCAQHGDTEFLVDGDCRLTFAQTYAHARALAGGLVEGYDLKKGDRVGIAARNSNNWLIAYMAIIMAGGVATLLNGWWQGSELAEGITLVDCRYVIADKQRAERLHGQDIGNCEFIHMDHDCMPDIGLSSLLSKGGGAQTVLPTLDALDNATILYTSGSTGKSKGAYSDHRAVVQGAMSYFSQFIVLGKLMEMAGIATTMQPCALVNVPLFHVTASIPLVLQSFAMGRKLVLMPKWDAEEAMRLIEKEKATYFVGVPLMSIEIATHPHKDKYDLTSCTAFAAGGAPRPVEHVKKIKEEMSWGFPLLGYGLTETNGVGCGNFNENYLAKPNSTGPASKPIVDVAIIDANGKHMPQGEHAEICIKTIANFNGYWANEQATKDAFTDDAYFRTGDIGYLDEDGYLFIVDRLKDIIIRGGENISCPEVEAAAYEHDEIVELSVLGISDEKYGEVPGIIYVTKEDKPLSADAFKAFIASKIAPFKVPVHYWHHEGELPRLGTQKIDRVALRKLFNDRVAG